ncbi:UDP-N-acetylmuramoyl-L-alanine--D-glutamate ligase [Brevibacillus laterosporus]|uniref:UDP-N-acetylmuramoylalanine--D-glutamate ligase n=1 Tax=Brevibacillus laterosporus LMG 15441 TaxID=1042163 RepID=A0A075R998_BRELA|nr:MULTISPECIES: UDP-N-acetylmuramoyl-L-alanine--D-glutamate ligase [Brevibacillus]HAS01742.1 UDP-N-acetylmuramoyl-L-alanine--D-glutamate ligase [Brevibacillus sp.]AIG27803.1 UDP-N-acetylmuramoylalanine--D-glutamate ligase [Brevibacillus laterosporus LMG 15441]ERM19302.1 UDP-N-acetylmuramoyl-L-alanyl-D-glutamate synthetase [Brevibacillus laterosporus PE36]MBA4533611.1 UDP-N-acetylmuramoyl-L-alanine--D-glutamate ligase [Brevibacillus halotolerans]MDF9410693.1 UDP-N-acetylmuramoyl-L-alanine--D-g
MDMYKGKLVVVLGLAKSGVAVAKLLHRFGAIVIVNDQKTREEATGYEELEELGVQVITGGHPDDLISKDVALVVKNPGIPYESKPVQQALAMSIPVITEVELAYRLSKAPLIGITGSNGKTTTTTLVGLILHAASVDAIVGGNIGTVLCSLAEEMKPDQYLVAELSSFQLMGTDTFRPHIATILNLYPAHLDYHHSFEEYTKAKCKIFANQTEEDYAVLPYDHEPVMKVCQNIRAKVFYVSIKQEVPCGAFIKDGIVYFKNEDGKLDEIMKATEISLPGEFNQENALAAIVMSKLAGADYDAMKHVLRSFSGVEHRLEYVDTIAGVKYYNNSKATNSEAAIRGIEAFKEPVVLIAGGLDRGVDFAELVPPLKNKVKAIITYGQTSPILQKRAEEAGIELRFAVDTVDSAVKQAAAIAEANDVVLLSPACASWDMFPSYEVRGSMFKDSVHKLKNKPI